VFVSKDARVVRRKKARLVHGKEEALNADNAVEVVTSTTATRLIAKTTGALGSSPIRRVSKVCLNSDGDKDNCDLYQCTWDEVLKKCVDGKGECVNQ
jgi:hypothetical protein